MPDKLKLKKGDYVIVISGNDKGRKGRVLKAYPKTNRVIVEKVHMIKKHAKPSQNNPQGGIISMEAPINASNVMLFNEKLNTVSKPVIKVREGHRIRVCKKSGDEL
ncbi:MAG: 50S ribosomal protein L24 [Candidatus Cloacimonetes bacterium]|jgi:large subunit ribosomal protein L24|nr:50S ribosomal protein L24 [Candidatus Cloacimonadota bacterium]MDD3143069.1 50S ribosomal protein L24 [Candidatus Cloacimonadota bacterium]MDY0367732.1 50S ribosomal protein L24 [Candidatus Syntrophosphaera sp.]HOY84876.1 50S ribosomal protein L24 [Candidatus Syntrophosphaera sp.]HPH60664.1 50S ribosomal protein L24 [Candidatus Syntrophosphaera sp.]